MSVLVCSKEARIAAEVGYKAWEVVSSRLSYKVQPTASAVCFWALVLPSLGHSQDCIYFL